MWFGTVGHSHSYIQEMDRKSTGCLAHPVRPGFNSTVVGQDSLNLAFHSCLGKALGELMEGLGLLREKVTAQSP